MICSYQNCVQQSIVPARTLLLGVVDGKKVYRHWHSCREHLEQYRKYSAEQLYAQECANPYFHMFFLLTEAHIALSRCLNIVWYGAPGVDVKRPYGNSDYLGDIVDITHCSADEAERLHHDMEIVVQLILDTSQALPGIYERPCLGERWTHIAYPEYCDELTCV